MATALAKPAATLIFDPPPQGSNSAYDLALLFPICHVMSNVFFVFAIRATIISVTVLHFHPFIIICGLIISFRNKFPVHNFRKINNHPRNFNTRTVTWYLSLLSMRLLNHNLISNRCAYGIKIYGKRHRK